VINGGIVLTGISSIKENVRAVKGVFLLRKGTMFDSDLNGISEQSLQHLSEITSYWKGTMGKRENDITRMSILAEDYCFLFFQDIYILGVMASEEINIPFLRVVVNRILELIINEIETLENEQLKLPETFAHDPLHFTQPREMVLSTAPRYAHKVLEFVDGTRSIKDIVEESLLPPEMVLDVILTYIKASILKFNES
jgi:hypothetical protein